MKNISLFGLGVANRAQTLTDQRRVNCYLDFPPDGEKSGARVIGTPGKTYFTSLAGNVRGWWVFNSVLYAVANNQFVSISLTGSVTQLGTIGSSSGTVSISDNGTTVNIVDGVSAYSYNPATVTFAPITNTSFPFGATTITTVAGFSLVEAPGTGQFWQSNRYDATTWAGLQFATSLTSPGQLTAVDSDHGVLILYSPSTIEFWAYQGTSPVAFQPIQGATQSVGLAAKFSRCKWNNTTAFLGLNENGLAQVYAFQGYTAQVISTPDIDSLINSFPIVSDAVGLAYMTGGHVMYQLTFQSANRTLVYDGTTQVWLESQSGIGLYARDIAQFGIVFNQKCYVSDSTSGNIYLLDNTNYTENGSALLRLLQTKHVQDNYDVLTVDELFLDMETGHGIGSTNANICLQVSKDNGHTFGTERWVSVGKQGQYKGPRVTWRRFGSSRDFVYRIKMTDPVKFFIAGAAITTRGLGK